MAFNEKYYDGEHMYQLLPKAQAFSTYLTSDSIVIGVFQGNRGEKPHLDFKVRILFDGPGKRPILPPHNYWVVDLMLKCTQFGKEVQEIAEYYLHFYDECTPFAEPEERNNYELLTREYIVKKYNYIGGQNTLSLDYVAIIIELFCLNEKQNSNAVMFRNLLRMIYEYSRGAKNYVELLEAAKPGFR